MTIDSTSSTDTSQSATSAESESQSTAEVQAEVSTSDTTGTSEQTTTTANQTDQETFFDPNSVPEELVPAYKQMQAAFTKKTQSIAEERKQAAELKAKAEAYAKYEKYTPILEEMFASENQVQSQSTAELAALEDQLRREGYSEEAIQMMKIGAQFTLNQFNQKELAKQKEAEQKQFITDTTARVNEAAKLDSRLTDENLKYQTEDGDTFTFGEMVESIVARNPKWYEDPVAATKKAIKIVDAMIGQAKTEGKTELSNLAHNKAKKFPNVSSSPQDATRSDGRYKSLSEAGKEAMKELGIT